MPVDFSHFKVGPTGPLYRQVVQYFKKSMLLGELKNAEEVPSRRHLAALLGINPTTVQKIYRQLEEEGLIQTTPYSKTIVTMDEGKRQILQKELIQDELKDLITSFKTCNMDFKEFIALVTQVWNEE
ncbi:GntR family transcriptional regulator [Sporanaerobium hydrogeniformans]|uniref:GntR family transcriptional regulator n=1 Tax=Sporanaerobium hydrogeniformans TaxID=3072179 RepID=A0AC61DB21_9FIRM|nr:GntR family transcriptional regulator [Sporanaerobium hydrogeniformans]PHV70474.1 GntR family transcriptional regulator [Sporanaerobium hydrogeniformans]